jgi:membrane-bound metal-dependent hydrolase YbcI (DUF457 family)
MDPITHGIAGSLLGKSFFTRREGRIATYAAILGAVFPDVDVFVEIFARDPLSVIRYHRGFTHSFVGLPIFALALAWLTRLVFRRRGAPSFWMLTLIYAVGIASHILLDATTSFGTRIWNPFSSDRVAWDLVFIVDFSFTAIVLVPQVAARVFSDRDRARRRGWFAWIAFTIAAIACWAFAGAMRFPFHAWILAIVAAVFAGVFIFPLAGGRGFAISETAWCLTGTFLALAYIAACGVAHHTALDRVEAFAAENHLAVVRLGAIPSPPSLLKWSLKIRVPDGVYQSRIDLRDPAPPVFQFLADSPHDAYVNDAMNLPDARVYLWFARFPVVHAHTDGDNHVVEFGDSRFTDPGTRLPEPFRLRFVLNPQGQLVEEVWSEGAAGLRTRKMIEKNPAPETK